MHFTEKAMRAIYSFSISNSNDFYNMIFIVKTITFVFTYVSTPMIVGGPCDTKIIAPIHNDIWAQCGYPDPQNKQKIKESVQIKLALGSPLKFSVCKNGNGALQKVIYSNCLCCPRQTETTQTKQNKTKTLIVQGVGTFGTGNI